MFEIWYVVLIFFFKLCPRRSTILYWYLWQSIIYNQ